MSFGGYKYGGLPRGCFQEGHQATNGSLFVGLVEVPGLDTAKRVLSKRLVKHGYNPLRRLTTMACVGDNQAY